MPTLSCLCAVPYFSNLGFACPALYNPADFLVDLICVDTSPEDEQQGQQRVLALQLAWEQRSSATGEAVSTLPPTHTYIHTHTPRPSLRLPAHASWSSHAPWRPHAGG